MAVENSVKQMALTRDTGPGGFMERLQAVLFECAGTILAEPANTPYHQGRALYATRVTGNPSNTATVAAPLVVMNSIITSVTTYDEQTKVAVCTVTDTIFVAEVNKMWNSLGGVDTPSGGAMVL